MNVPPVVALVAAIAGAWLLLVVILFALRPRGTGLREVAATVPDILRLVRDLLRDESAPLAVRIALIGLLAWLVNPIDLIPEFIPVLGPLDDVVVAVIMLRFVRHRLGDDELRRRWRGSHASFEVLLRLL